MIFTINYAITAKLIITLFFWLQKWIFAHTKKISEKE